MAERFAVCQALRGVRMRLAACRETQMLEQLSLSDRDFAERCCSWCF